MQLNGGFEDPVPICKSKGAENVIMLFNSLSNTILRAAAPSHRQVTTEKQPSST